MRAVGKICSCPVHYGVQNWDLEKAEQFRAPRSSSQQGKKQELKQGDSTSTSSSGRQQGGTPSQILGVLRQRSLIARGTEAPLRRDNFPNAQLLPFSGKKDCQQKLSKSVLIDQQEPLQIQYELLVLPPVLPFPPVFLQNQGRSHGTGKGR